MTGPRALENEKHTLLGLPPVSPHETSLSKTESLSAPDWKDKDQTQAVAWFLELRAAIKIIVYRLMSNIQEAQQIFRETGATRYVDYKKLAEAFNDLWLGWTSFVDENEMTSDFLEVALDFLNLTPIIRQAAAVIHGELHTVRSRIEESIILLHESQDGHAFDQFPELPTLEEVEGQVTIEIPSETAEEEYSLGRGWPENSSWTDLYHGQG